MSIYSDKLAHVQVVMNSQDSVARMCTREDTLVHNLGAPYFYDAITHSQQCFFFFSLLNWRAACSRSSTKIICSKFLAVTSENDFIFLLFSSLLSFRPWKNTDGGKVRKTCCTYTMLYIEKDHIILLFSSLLLVVWFCFLLLSPPAKRHCRDIIMRAVQFWGQGSSYLLHQRVSYLWLKKRGGEKGKRASALG